VPSGAELRNDERVDEGRLGARLCGGEGVWRKQTDFPVPPGGVELQTGSNRLLDTVSYYHR